MLIRTLLLQERGGGRKKTKCAELSVTPQLLCRSEENRQTKWKADKRRQARQMGEDKRGEKGLWFMPPLQEMFSLALALVKPKGSKWIRNSRNLWLYDTNICCNELLADSVQPSLPRSFLLQNSHPSTSRKSKYQPSGCPSHSRHQPTQKARGTHAILLPEGMGRAVEQSEDSVPPITSVKYHLSSLWLPFGEQDIHQGPKGNRRTSLPWVCLLLSHYV